MLRELDIPPDWVAEGKLGPLQSWMGPDLTPEEARELQGTILFAFPELEVDDVEIFDVVGVIEWLRLVHSRIPHLLYFLEPSPDAGALEGLVRTLVSPGVVREGGSGIPLDEGAAAGLVTHLAAAAVFSLKVGDDWRPILGRLLESVEQKHREAILVGVRDGLGPS